MKKPPGFLDGLRKEKPEVDPMEPINPRSQDERNHNGSPKQHGTNNQSQDHAGLHDLLPGDEAVWRNSILGHPKDWGKALQSYALTLSSFAYPAAIFWTDELVLLHNEHWSDAGGMAKQGERQRGDLSADAFRSLSSALHGGQPKTIASRELLRSESKDRHEQYIVLISPLFSDNAKAGAAGLLAQLLPKPDSDGDGKRKNSEASSLGNQNLDEYAKNGKVDISLLGSVVDSVPLDDHPFFHRFAEMLPSGLAILDHRAQCVFVNQHFYKLTTHKGEEQSFKSWPQSIHPEDYDRVMNAYQEAFASQKQLRTEFRSTGDQHPWRLLLLTPLGDENLQHVSLRDYGGFICSLVDISSEKSAEISERKAAKEARERREQQERFIDMISHEIRNPLSAVLHCSEDIDEAISDEKSVDIEAIKEAIDTIKLCLQHQRNIVDDVLSYSKLDASMLSLAPKSCHPSENLANTLKMFQPEFRKQGLHCGFTIDTSYTDFKVEWVMADMARIGQVLVNLISNAVKFTARSKGEKDVTVMVGASYERPTSYPPNLVFFSSDDLSYKLDNTNGSEWGNGEEMYIVAAVKDTGIGISEDGQKRLFERFRQATPKTSDVYGGSGLGLNISRKLCHLHGGEIGVSSKEGAGSTFGFFFKVKRSDRPGDYNGRPEEQAMEDDRIEGLITAHGQAGDSDVKPQDVFASISDPPVEDTVAAPPDRSDQKDYRYQQTLRVANKVKEPEADSYKYAEAPTEEKRRRSGTPYPPDEGAVSEAPSTTGSGGPDDTMVKKENEVPKTAQHPGEVSSNDAGHPKGNEDLTTDESKPSRKVAHEHGEQSPSKSVETKPKRHVLLVEDNAINQRIVNRKLQAKGFRVTTANNGREAVDAVRKAPKPSSGDHDAFDIILMDQEMPVLDGNAASREIRDLADGGEVEAIPILGVTANVRGAQQDEMVRSGMHDIITKPYKIDDMVKKINEVTDKMAKSKLN